MSAATAGAQTGRIVGEPVSTPEGSSGLPLVAMLVAAGVIIVVASLLSLRRVGAGRRTPVSKETEVTEDELRAAKADMLSSRTKDALCAEAAHQAVVLARADGAAVILDDFDGRAGTPIEVHENLVTRVHREKTLVKLKRVRALPIIEAGEVIGLVAATGGDTETLSAISRFVSEAYTSRHQSSTNRLDAAVAKAADIDGLTGVGNRRRFDNDLAAVANEGEKMPVSLAMFDVDHFQFYNDAHGKQAGNEVLKSVAELIAGNLRGSDVMYRYSGVKFVALLPGANVDNAEVVVERIRAAVESTRFDGEEVQPLGRVTLSVGVAEAPSDNTATLIDAAGYALERAKASGRNSVVIEADIA